MKKGVESDPQEEIHLDYKIMVITFSVVQCFIVQCTSACTCILITRSVKWLEHYIKVNGYYM